MNVSGALARALLVLTALGVSASAPTQAASGNTTTTTRPTTATATTTATTSAATGADPVQAHLDWIIANAHRPVSAAVYAARFDKRFRDAVSLSRLNASLRSVTGGKPLTLVGDPVTQDQTDARTSSATRFVVRSADGRTFNANISVEPNSRHLIAGLTFTPAQQTTAGVAPARMGLQLASIAPDQGWLVSEVKGTRCTRIDGDDAGLPKPTASAFKLVVLASLADVIEAKAISWDDELTITAALKSPFSGELFTRPEGSKVSVREAAKLMISISDNTATDLLMSRLGRDRIEADQRRFVVTDPERNMPFLTTREMTQLKFGAARAELDAYAAGDMAERRAILTRVAGLPLPDLRRVPLDEPVLVDQVEWFLSMEDLCRLHARLRSQADRPALTPLKDILGANPGIPLDKATWPRTQFKGGSEPGVIALSWLLDRADGRRFFVGVALADDAASIDDLRAISTVAGVFPWIAARR